jgi:hypothetical protein
MRVSTAEVLRMVEEESYAMNRHLEFKRCYEHYRTQIGVSQSIRFALEDMQLQDLLETLIDEQG